jgi:NADP-dependent 3-hydroxy acid dehydrogenase YdfG
VRAEDGPGKGYSGVPQGAYSVVAEVRAKPGKEVELRAIEPGFVDSELKYNTTGSAQKMVLDLYAKTAIPAETIARAIAYAMEQPPDVDINEIIIRPTAQEF